MARLFAETSVLVSVHGAGLSNMIFMAPGSTVVELISPDRLWPTYRSMADRLGLKYIAIVGDRVPLSEGETYEGDWGNRDLTVRRAFLRDVLNNL